MHTFREPALPHVYAGTSAVWREVLPTMHTHELLPGFDTNVRRMLAQMQITTSEELLRHAGEAQQAQLARQLGVSGEAVAEWIRYTDLLRLTGMTPALIQLLQACQVVSSRAIAGELPARLHTRMKVANDHHRYVDLVPTYVQVVTWSLEASALHRD